MKLQAKLAVAFISLAACLAGNAKAISIDDFARMNNDDEATYVALLVQGSAGMLKARGEPEQADKLIALFKDPGKQGGVQQFAAHLKTAEASNNRNATNPNNRVPVYQVEDALSFMLKDNGINVPASFLLTININFIPAGPPRSHMTGQ